MDRCGAPLAPLRARPPKGDSGCPASPHLHYQTMQPPSYKGDRQRRWRGRPHTLSSGPPLHQLRWSPSPVAAPQVRIADCLASEALDLGAASAEFVLETLET